MSWRDDFAYLNNAIQQNYVGSAPSYRPPRFRSSPVVGYDPRAVSKPSAPTWSEFTQKAASPARQPGYRGPQAPAAPPERFAVDLYRPPVAQAAPVSTEGDPLGCRAVPGRAIPQQLPDVLAPQLPDQVGQVARPRYVRPGGRPADECRRRRHPDEVRRHPPPAARDRPEYGEWFEKHQTLVFVAQMLVPITPSSMSVSLNSILRDVFFNSSKAV